jgi:SAM-dependent methyltransferase
MASEARFGYEWERYNKLDANYELQFKKWLGPVTPDFLRGKKILDAGCGMGRNSYWCLVWGAREVVAFDNDDRTVAAARILLKDFPNAAVRKENIYDIQYENEFDFVFSIGVIHHLANPARAVGYLIRAAKPGGVVLLWLYAREGNEWLLWFLDPLRKYITSHLPAGLLHAFTYGLSIPFWLYLRIWRPDGEYYKQLRAFTFRHVHSIIFDQLLPRIAHYYTKEEAQELFRGLSDIRVVHVNDQSWAVTGVKK